MLDRLIALADINSSGVNISASTREDLPVGERWKKTIMYNVIYTIYIVHVHTTLCLCRVLFHCLFSYIVLYIHVIQPPCKGLYVGKQRFPELF